MRSAASALALATFAAASFLVVGSGATTATAGQEPGDTPDVVRVAYPDEPGPWYPGDATDTAAVDLAALWGLPLYRVDAHGQLRPALAERATIVPGDAADPWTVAVELRAGSWSDGVPITADDVVATIASLQEEGIEVGPLASVEATGPRTVELRFSRPYARWPYLLSGGTPVLPAHVIEDAGVDAYRDAPPVSGGPYRLAAREPGLRATFVAAEESPLGGPRIPTIEVWFVHDFDTALGLLAADRVDVVTGYLAVDTASRVAEINGVEAGAPLGGTWSLLAWSDVAEDLRRTASDAIGVAGAVEALFDGVGTAATSTLPGVEGPWDPSGGVAGIGLRDADLIIAAPEGQEATSLLGRAVDRELRSAGASVDLVTTDEVDAVEGADARVVVRRDLPWPSLVGRATDGASGLQAALTAADAAPTPTAADALDAQMALREAAPETPLVRFAVTTVWRSGLGGVLPSSWPGVALWNAAAWEWGGGS